MDTTPVLLLSVSKGFRWLDMQVDSILSPSQIGSDAEVAGNTYAANCIEFYSANLQERYEVTIEYKS
jgi:hypothetical protein